MGARCNCIEASGHKLSDKKDKLTHVYISFPNKYKSKENCYRIPGRRTRETGTGELKQGQTAREAISPSPSPPARTLESQWLHPLRREAEGGREGKRATSFPKQRRAHSLGCQGQGQVLPVRSGRPVTGPETLSAPGQAAAGSENPGEEGARRLGLTQPLLRLAGVRLHAWAFAGCASQHRCTLCLPEHPGFPHAVRPSHTFSYVRRQDRGWGHPAHGRGLCCPGTPLWRPGEGPPAAAALRTLLAHARLPVSAPRQTCEHECRSEKEGTLLKSTFPPTLEH